MRGESTVLPVDHIAHMAHHQRWIGVAVAMMSSTIGVWICIWVAIFSNRKNADASDVPDEPDSLQNKSRQKSPDRRTSFSV